MRLIDADALKYKNLAEVNGILTYVLTSKEINNAPTVPLPDFKEGYKQAIIDGKTNFSRPKGKWIDRNGNTWCSECRYDTIYLEGDRPLRTDFCPNCGADMREV